MHAGYLRLQIHTLRICNTLCFSIATMVAWTLRSVTLCVLCLYCLISYPSLYVRILQAVSCLVFYNIILCALFFPMRVTWPDYPILFDFTIVIIFGVKYKLRCNLLWIFLSSSCDYPNILPRPTCVFTITREMRFHVTCKKNSRNRSFVYVNLLRLQVADWNEKDLELNGNRHYRN